MNKFNEVYFLIHNGYVAGEGTLEAVMKEFQDGDEIAKKISVIDQDKIEEELDKNTINYDKFTKVLNEWTKTKKCYADSYSITTNVSIPPITYHYWNDTFDPSKFIIFSNIKA